MLLCVQVCVVAFGGNTYQHTHNTLIILRAIPILIQLLLLLPLLLLLLLLRLLLPLETGRAGVCGGVRRQRLDGVSARDDDAQRAACDGAEPSVAVD